MGIFIGIALNLQIALDVAILTIFFQFTSMRYLRISLNHLLFTLLIFYNSQHLSLSPPWPGLFLGIYIWCYFKRYWFFYIPFLIFHC